MKSFGWKLPDQRCEVFGRAWMSTRACGARSCRVRSERSAMPTLSTYSSREASTTIGRAGLALRVSMARRQIGAAVYAVMRPSSAISRHR